MKCPVCRETDLLMTERMEVEIDYCPQCRGIWLDRGELDKLLERAERGGRIGPERQEDHPYRGGHRHDDHHKGHTGYGAHHSRRRSWLSNLLDFD